MSDTRVESDPFRYVRLPVDDDCDDATKTCGNNMSLGNPHEDPVVVAPQQRPAEIAAIAKNLMRAQYETMSNDALDKAVQTLSKRLTSGKSYEGYADDQARFDIAEKVMTERNAKDPPKGATNEQLTTAKAREDAKMQDAEAWRTPIHSAEVGHGWVAEKKIHQDERVTVGDVRVELSTSNAGPSATGLHGEAKKNVHGVDVTASADAGVVNYGPGFHNKDGSTGVHLGGNATIVGIEGTIHKAGAGSVTAGAGEGLAAEASIGVKKEGNTVEVCGRVSAQWWTLGACMPVWNGRM